LAVSKPKRQNCENFLKSLVPDTSWRVLRKLDLLGWLADQVRGSVEEKRRMKLTINELEDVLRREGITPEDGNALNAKDAVTGLLRLRRREIARLGYDSEQSKAQASDQSFELALASMTVDKVDNCFEIVVFNPAAIPAMDTEQGTATSQSSAPPKWADSCEVEPNPGMEAEFTAPDAVRKSKCCSLM